LNDDRDHGVRAIDHGANVGGRLGRFDDLKASAVGEARNKLPALLAMIEIKHRSRHVVHFEGRRVAENDHLNERGDDEAKAGLTAAPELQELLQHQIEYPPPHRLTPAS